MARKILRKVASVAPVNNTVIRTRLPLGTTVSRYFLRYTATLTIGVASVAAVLEDAPYGYLRSVDLILNGSFPLRSLDGRGYFFLNRIQEGTPPQNTPPPVTVGAAAIVAEFSIDLGQIDLRPPLDAAHWLDTRLLSSLELVITFGNEADIVNASGTSTQVLSAQNVDVYAEEVADVGGPLSRMRYTRIQQLVAATGDLDIQLPALGPAYRLIAVHATSQTTPGGGTAITDPIRQTSDDTIINTLSLIADNVVRHVDTSPYRSLRQDNKLFYHIETMPPGWAVMDFARSQNLRDLILTPRTRQLILRSNIASAPANAFLQVYPLDDLLVVRQPLPQRRPVRVGR